MTLLHPHVYSVTAFAPATCANVAVGFDILGFALETVGDHVTLTRREDKQVIIEHITSVETLPFATEKNTASVVIKKLVEDLQLPTGFSIRIEKGIALGSGMGGSAASAVAALVACNAFLTQPLSLHQLARYALLGEEVASGQPHADNIVPCLFGGITLICSSERMEIVKLPTPDLFCVIVHPHLRVETKQARKILKPELSLADHVTQSAYLAGFIAALYRSDYHLLQHSLFDVVIEPQRAGFVPGFYEIKQAALDAGALGASFSGSGPSLFALTSTQEQAEQVRAAMCARLKIAHIATDSWISRISPEGARIIHSS